MKKFIALITDRKMALVFAMGFASGLPLLLTGGTLQAWFTERHVDLHTIGLFSLVGLPYTFKFAWAPFFDRWVPPFLGRRRGWLAITQVLLILSLAALAFSDPGGNNIVVALIALVITFMSASQDIAIDAYRREILPTSALGFGNSLTITGYRLGMLLAGSGALILSDYIGFRGAYLFMAAAAGFGLLTTFLAPEPIVPYAPPKTMQEAFVAPFKEFFAKDGALWILAFIVLYKLGDNMATALTTPFYLGLGYTKTNIGAIGKFFGLWSTIVGGLVGGTVMFWLGIRRALWIFGILQALANLCFAWMAVATPTLPASWHLPALAITVSVENLTQGLGTAAYTAFMASLTNKKFTATQYALLTSLMGVPRVILPSMTGFLIEQMGWSTYFVFCTAISVPGLLLLLKIGKWAPGPEGHAQADPEN